MQIKRARCALRYASSSDVSRGEFPLFTVHKVISCFIRRSRKEKHFELEYDAEYDFYDFQVPMSTWIFETPHQGVGGDNITSKNGYTHDKKHIRHCLLFAFQIKKNAAEIRTTGIRDERNFNLKDRRQRPRLKI